MEQCPSALGRSHPPALRPASLDVLVDIVNKCNLRCIMCHFTFDEVFHQRSRLMTPDAFERIASSVRPYARRLTLSAAYEPTVSPHFPEILRIAARHAFPETSFLTHGNCLPDHLAETIVRCGVTEVCFSVHAARRDTYAHIVRGGHLERVLRNVEGLRRIRDDLGLRTPRLQFNIAIMKSNLAELREIIDLAARVGADSVAFRHLIVFEGLGMEAESLARHDKRLTNLCIQRALERARECGLAVYNSPDYFEVDGVDARMQIVDWALDPPGHDVHPANAPRLESASRPLPFGNIDVPAEGSRWCGETIEVSGWALGDAGIRALQLKRDPVPEDPSSAIGQDGLVEIGIARFHNATRNDVMRAHPDRPYGYRAGWSYLLARSTIPETRQEHVVVRALAVDRDGVHSVIGVRTLALQRGTVDEGAVRCRKPFDSLYIDAHGYAYPYPDCHTDTPFGSLMEQSLEEIWHGWRLAELRRDLAEGRSPEMCRRCPLFINRAVNDDGFFEPHADFSREDRR